MYSLGDHMQYRRYDKYTNMQLVQYKQEIEGKLAEMLEEAAHIEYVIATLKEELWDRLLDIEYDLLEAEDDKMREDWPQTYIN